MQGIDSTYVHAIEGRLRIKLAEVKASPPKAADVEGKLRALDGVEEVSANPTTGNVLVLYDSGRITQPEIIDALRALGCLRPNHWARARAARKVTRLRDTVALAVVRSCMEFALQRVLRVLI